WRNWRRRVSQPGATEVVSSASCHGRRAGQCGPRIRQGRGRASGGRRETSDSAEERRLALPDADAEGGETDAAMAPAKLVAEADDEPGPAHPERMADRDRTAVHVYSLAVEPELPDYGKALRCKRLVQLHEVDVGDAQARPLEQLPDGRDRPDPHH